MFTSKCGKKSSITLLTPNKNFSHFHPLNNKEKKVMIVEFYWLYLNRLLLLPQQYCTTTIKLFWHITLNISAWTCQLCTSGATVQCQELLVTLRILFTIRQRETTVSESSCFRCCPVPCHPSWLWPACTQGSSERFSASGWKHERLWGAGTFFPLVLRWMPLQSSTGIAAASWGQVMREGKNNEVKQTNVSSRSGELLV